MKTKQSVLALLLLLPAPSLGVLVGMHLAPGSAAGKWLFLLSKVWILGLPLGWRIAVDRERVSWSRCAHGGLGVGVLLGVGISAVIAVAYCLVGRSLIDAAHMREIVGGIGLADPRAYLVGAAYWILVNSVLEEYVWRWFVVSRFQDLMRARGAVLASALAFTVHHAVAMSTYFGLTMVVIASLGIFIGGAAWSWCYIRYRSVWPGYVSHAIVDAAVFGIGYHIIFG